MDEFIRTIAKETGFPPSLIEKAFNMQFKFLVEIARTVDPTDPSTYEEKVVYLQSLGKFIPDKRVMSNMTDRYKRNGGKRKIVKNDLEHSERMEELCDKEQSD